MTSRHYVWTLNNPTEEEVDRLTHGLSETFQTQDGHRYSVVGLEIGEEGTMHLQGYTELTRPMRLRGFQRFLNPLRPAQVHVERRRGTRDQARNYVRDDAKETSLGWVETGDWTSGGQGQRNDIEDCKSMLLSNAPMAEIADKHFGTWCRNYRAFATFRTLTWQQSIPDWRDINVTVHWGTTGTGKTRAACAVCESHYKMNQPEGTQAWFDFYAGEELLILDDFTGWLPLAYLLNLLDGYPMRVATKGGHTWAAWTKVIITSNIPPSAWYKPEAVARHPGALQRRVNEIIFFDDQGPRPSTWTGLSV